MPQKIFAKFYACKFLYPFVGRLNVGTNFFYGHYFITNHHATAQYINIQFIFICCCNFFYNRAKTIAPATVSIVTINKGWFHNAKIAIGKALKKSTKKIGLLRNYFICKSLILRLCNLPTFIRLIMGPSTKFKKLRL